MQASWLAATEHGQVGNVDPTRALAFGAIGITPETALAFAIAGRGIAANLRDGREKSGFVALDSSLNHKVKSSCTDFPQQDEQLLALGEGHGRVSHWPLAG